MYLPKQFEETRTEVLHDLMRAQPFGTLVVATNEGLSVDHIPFVLNDGSGPLGVLHGHVARANPLVNAARTEVDAVVIFQGPHHYISPSWYATKHETGEVVPTWNYVVVHAHGRLELVDDAAWLRRHVEALTQQQERSREAPWKVSDAPDEFVAKLIGGIVGIELSLTRLVGKWKLGQNRPEVDRQSMVDGLRGEGDVSALALADLIPVPGGEHR